MNAPNVKSCIQQLQSEGICSHKEPNAEREDIQQHQQSVNAYQRLNVLISLFSLEELRNKISELSTRLRQVWA